MDHRARPVDGLDALVLERRVVARHDLLQQRRAGGIALDALNRHLKLVQDPLRRNDSNLRIDRTEARLLAQNDAAGRTRNHRSGRHRKPRHDDSDVLVEHHPQILDERFRRCDVAARRMKYQVKAPVPLELVDCRHERVHVVVTDAEVRCCRRPK